MNMECHEFFKEKLHKELEMLKAKYSQDPSKQMSMQDLEELDKIYHVLKCQKTYCAMENPEEYMDGGFSGRRGRSMTTGRYVSRDMGTPQSYADGYSEGYSEAMNQMGGYPPRRF